MFLWGRNNLGWSFNFFLFALFSEVGRVFGTVLVFLVFVPLYVFSPPPQLPIPHYPFAFLS